MKKHFHMNQKYFLYMENKMDNHIILLRINQYWDSLGDNHPSQLSREQVYKGNPNWLDIRLEWFEKYILQNLKTQDDMEFWCFMLIDPQTPPKYKDKLYSYEKFNFIKILETNGDKGLGMDELILDTYKSIRRNNNNEVICSRLDTDDMVGPYWNIAVKQLLENQNRISLETVLLYNFLNKETRIIKYSKGSFVSTKSTLDKFDNPRSFSHGSSNALSVDTEYPLVCMGIHDNNITNQNWWLAGQSLNIPEDQLNQMFKFKK